MAVKAIIRETLIDTCIRTERQKVANLNIDSIKLEKEQKLNPKKVKLEIIKNIYYELDRAIEFINPFYLEDKKRCPLSSSTSNFKRIAFGECTCLPEGKTYTIFSG